MKDDSLYVHVLRTDQIVFGVFAEEEAAKVHRENFTRTHREMFPEEPDRKVHLERHEVIGGTAK